LRLPLLVMFAAALLSFGSFTSRSSPAAAATTVVMYGTTGGGDQLSSLYRIDPATGAGTLIGPTGYRGISGIDFHPQTGELYGIGRRQSDDVLVLLRINTTTGAATEVGPLGAPVDVFRVPDISFRQSDATLFAWTFFPEKLASINVTTGAANVFGASSISGPGDSLAFDSQGNLFHTVGQSFTRVNPTTGAVTVISSLTFNGTPVSTAVSALEFHPQTGALYALVGAVNAQLATIDPNTGVVRIIGTTVSGLDSLAIQVVATAATVAPQTFQNPGAVAIVNARPAQVPAPLRPVTAAVSPEATIPVLRPPSTGNAGLKSD